MVRVCDEKEIAVIGDVHGEAAALGNALESHLGRRRVVLVGDYVNRGPRSAKVLDLLAEALTAEDIFLLMGNHDYEFIRYIETGDLARFARIGGLSTIKSYTGMVEGDLHQALLDQIPESHLNLLETLSISYEDPSLIVSHSGVSPRSPGERDVRALVLGNHPELFGAESTNLPKVVVSGHYAQRSMRVFDTAKYICLDSGCGTLPGAPLAVLEWPERLFSYFEV